MDLICVVSHLPYRCVRCIVQTRVLGAELRWRLSAWTWSPIELIASWSTMGSRSLSPQTSKNSIFCLLFTLCVSAKVGLRQSCPIDRHLQGLNHHHQSTSPFHHFLNWSFSLFHPQFFIFVLKASE